MKRNKTRKNRRIATYKMEYSRESIAKTLKLYVYYMDYSYLSSEEFSIFYNNINNPVVRNVCDNIDNIIAYYKTEDNAMYNYLMDLVCIVKLYSDYSNNIETFRVHNDIARMYIVKNPDIYERITGKPYDPENKLGYYKNPYNPEDYMYNKWDVLQNSMADEFASIISNDNFYNRYKHTDIYDEICWSNNWSMGEYNQIFNYLLDNPSIPVYDTLFALAANSINVCGRPVSGLCRSAEELLSSIEMFDELNNGPIGDLPYDERPDIRGLLDALSNYGGRPNVATWKRICEQFHERVKAKFNERFNWDEFSIEELY